MVQWKVELPRLLSVVQKLITKYGSIIYDSFDLNYFIYCTVIVSTLLLCLSSLRPSEILMVSPKLLDTFPWLQITKILQWQ